MIAPMGIATDATTAAFFGSLVEQRKLVALYTFDNEALIFPAVHHFTRFALLVQGWTTSEESADFCCLLRHVEQLADSRRHFSLTAEQVESINPNTKTSPVFRSRLDAELSTKIYANVPVFRPKTFGLESGMRNVQLRTMLHKTNASAAGDLVPRAEAQDDPENWLSFTKESTGTSLITGTQRTG